jgi:hypothetical protein
MKISGPILTEDNIRDMYYGAIAEHGRVPMEWRVGRSYWSALYHLKTGDGMYLWKSGIGSASPISLSVCQR